MTAIEIKKRKPNVIIKGIHNDYHIQDFNEDLIHQNEDVHQLIQEDSKHVPKIMANPKNI